MRIIGAIQMRLAGQVTLRQATAAYLKLPPLSLNMKTLSTQSMTNRQVKATVDSGSTPKAKGDALIEAVFAASAAMEEKDVAGEKYLVVSPVVYSYLAQSDAVNKDITSGDNGGINKGTVMEVAGIRIYKSNYVPVDSAVDVGGTNKKLKALLFTSEAVAVAKLMDVTSEVNYIPEQLATLMTTYYSYGMGVLKPACSCVITGGNA